MSGWAEVERDPRALLALRVCGEEWLAHALPTLRARARDGGDAQAVLAAIDARLEGGALPDEALPDRGASAAFVAGELAREIAFDGGAADRAHRVRSIRRLRIALPWVARALGLPKPDATYARVGTEGLRMGADLGRVSEPEWFEAVEEVLIDAYLESDDPRAQSGKSGDETAWRWSRELVLDAFEGDGAILDVGCANGYVMESLHRWGAERGRTIEPYGLEISARMAALARRRLPAWADRIFVGNVLDWTPPRRFDVVHTGLDYVLPPRRRALVRRLLDRFLEPGGCVVVRAERAVEGTPDPAERLRSIGIAPTGTLEAIHPDTGERRITAFVRR
jgi:hypothetical protein